MRTRKARRPQQFLTKTCQILPSNACRVQEPLNLSRTHASQCFLIVKETDRKFNMQAAPLPSRFPNCTTAVLGMLSQRCFQDHIKNLAWKNSMVYANNPPPLKNLLNNTKPYSNIKTPTRPNSADTASRTMMMSKLPHPWFCTTTGNTEVSCQK